MRRIVRTLHIYLGLLTVTTLVVFGAVGITAALGWVATDEEAAVASTVQFLVPGDRPDGEIADLIVRSGVTAPVGPDQRWWVAHAADGSLVVHVSGLNGSQRIRVDEVSHRLEIATSRSTLRSFLSDLHARWPRPTDDVRLRLWSGYVEFSAWALLGLALSGTWLGLRARRQCRPAWYAGLAGTATVLAMYALTR